MSYETMINEEIFARLEWLHLVLMWCSDHPLLETCLTDGQRIMVNQERAALFRALEGEHNGFVQSPIVTDKITRIEFLIERSQWAPKY